jgi:hypothetical protein
MLHRPPAEGKAEGKVERDRIWRVIAYAVSCGDLSLGGSDESIDVGFIGIDYR